MVALSIIIVNYNAKELLKGCIQSIYGQTFSTSLEIWVIDNGSKDGSAEEIGKNFPQVNWVQNKDNPGFSAALNMGFHKMAGRYALVLNPDTFVLPDSLDRMVRFMEAQPEVGILGPKVYDDRQKTSVQLSCRRFPTWTTVLFHRYSIITKFFPNNPWSREYLMSDKNPDSIQEVDWVSGCCMLIRRETLEQVGLFDETFFMFSEDVDYCRRAKNLGWGIFYFPEAEIVHFIGASKGKVKPRLIIERHKSIRHYLRKHCIQNPFMAMITDTVIFLRACCLLILNIFK